MHGHVMPAATVFAGRVILQTPTKLVAVRPGDGSEIWHRDDPSSPVRSRPHPGDVTLSPHSTVEPEPAPTLTYTAPVIGGYRLYWSVPAPFEFGPALLALNPLNGEILWRKPFGTGGLIAADDSRLVVANNKNGVSTYLPDGTPIFNFAQVVDYDHIFIAKPHIVISVTEDGAVLRGAIQSFDYFDGKYIGEAAYVNDLLTLTSTTASMQVVQLEEPGFECGHELVDRINLSRPVSGALLTQRQEFVIQSIATMRESPCEGLRAAYPAIFRDGDLYWIGSGPLISIFRADSPSKPLAISSDGTLVGGPYAGRMFADRDGIISALGWTGKKFVSSKLWANTAADVAVAGLGDRLYLSDQSTTNAYDTHTWKLVQSYKLACRQISPIYHTPTVDVLSCVTSDANPKTTAVGLRVSSRL